MVWLPFDRSVHHFHETHEASSAHVKMEPLTLAREKTVDESVEALTPEQVEDERPDFLRDCEHREKQLVRKVDWRLLPVLGGLYAIALVDRSNVDNLIKQACYIF